MGLEAWLAFCATETVLCFIPGPAVLFVVSSSLTRGKRAGFAAAFGILAGNAFYFALSGTGVAAVVVASYRLFTVLKWLGAAYLIYLGACMLTTRRRAAVQGMREVDRSFARGFIVQAANPKALVFFVALLPQFIDPRAPVGWQILVLGVSSVLIELMVLALYVAATVRAKRLAGTGLASSLERVGGAFLIAAGARLALVRSQ